MPIKVEAFAAPGCKRCAQGREALKAAVDELGPDGVSWRDVNILEEIDYAVDIGVLSTPAIAIDGKLVFAALPSPDALRSELGKRLAKAAQDSAA